MEWHMETLSQRSIKGSLVQCLLSRHMSIFHVCSPSLLLLAGSEYLMESSMDIQRPVFSLSNKLKRLQYLKNRRFVQKHVISAYTKSYTGWNDKFSSHCETPYIFNWNCKYINQMYVVIAITQQIINVETEGRKIACCEGRCGRTMLMKNQVILMLYHKRQQHEATSYCHRTAWQSLQHLAAVGSMLGLVQHADVKKKQKNKTTTKQTKPHPSKILENASSRLQKNGVWSYINKFRSGV